MGAPLSKVESDGQPAAETLLGAFETMDSAERQKHVAVLDYWLSIRGANDFPPIRDLDPLQISDVTAHSLLLELAGGGEDAEIRHLGEELKPHGGVAKVSEAPRPSLLACIAAKLGIVAISRNFLSFEDEFAFDGVRQRARITLLPFSSTGAWVDFVYGVVSLEAATEAANTESVIEPEPEAVAAEPEPETAVEEPERVILAEELEETTEIPPIVVEDEMAPPNEPEPESAPEAVDEPEPQVVPEPEPEAIVEESPEAGADAEPEELAVEEVADRRPGFTKLFDAIAGVSGFYGTNARAEPTLPPIETVDEPELEASAEPEPEPEPEPVAIAEPAPDEVEVTEVASAAPDETAADPELTETAHAVVEGSLHSKLEEVRAKADEAHQARLRSEAALIEGVGAAYDFALDAETSPEEYLRLVEAQGLKIQLRSPMAPVAKLAFDGLCDEPTLRQVEKVIAWALKEELPRGTLTERIQAAGGLGPLLSEAA